MNTTPIRFHSRCALRSLPVVVLFLIFAGLAGTDAAGAIAIRAASQASGVGSSLAINKPTGVVDGDFMVAGISINKSSSSDPTITPPSGWTLVRSLPDGLVRTSIYQKTAGSSEPSSYTWTISTSVRVAGGIAAYSGVDATTPIQVENGVVEGTTSTTSHTTPTIATTGSETWLVSVFGDRTGTTSSTWTTPSGATERVDVRTTQGTSPNVSLTIHDEGPVTAGNKSHTATASVSSQDAAMEIIALNAAATTPTLVGHWELDEGSGTSAADSSGSGNAGTLSNGPAWTAGKNGNGLDFDGVDDVVSSGSGSSLDNLPAITVAAWIKADSMGEGGYGRIVQKGAGTSPTAGWRLLTEGTNQIGFAVDYATDDLQRATATNSITTGSWYHVAATWAGSATATDVKIYVNGAEVSSYATTITGSGTRGDDNADNLYIGNDSTTARTFDGTLDDVRVYDGVLSAAEIEAIYESGNTPNAPSGLSATAASSSQINLTWADNSDNETAFKIERKTGAGGTYGQIDTTGANATTYNNTGLAVSTEYYYKVRATNAAGDSSYSNEDNATTDAGVAPLVGHWELDEGSGTSAADLSGNGNTGTLSNGPAWTGGKIGNALDFDGVDDVVSSGSGSSLDNLSALTVAAWIKADSMGEGGYGRIVQKGAGTSPTAGWRLLTQGTNQIGFAVDYATEDLQRATATNSITTGSWYHVAATWAGSATATDVKIYVNGAEVSSYATTITGSGTRGDDSAANLYIGNDSTTARTFDGTLDDVSVYSGVLTAAEIEAIYEAGLIDTDAPTVSLTSPANGVSVGGTISVTADASDNVGVVGVQFKLDGNNLGSEDTTSPYSISWNTTGSSDGSHTLIAVARDAAGSSTTSSAVIVTVDNSAPTVSITAPADQATVSGTSVSVTASASDNEGIVGVQFKLNGADLGTEDTSSPYSINWDTNEVADGNHMLTAVGRDAAGNLTTSGAVTVDVSNTTLPTPAGHWELDEGSGTSAADSSGNGNTGTLSNGPIWTGGKVSNGLDFDGADDVVNSGSGVSLDNLSALTVAAWIKADSMGEGGYGRIVQKGAGTSPTAGWRLLTQGTNQIAFAVDYATDDLQRATPTNSITTGTWYHVAATWAGSATATDVKIYVNGAEMSSYATTITGSGTRGDDNADNLYIGNDSTAARTFDGTLDDVRVYDGVLSAAEIEAIYEAGLSGTEPTVSVTSPANSASVGGTISVTADASDNVGVVGVQFKLDDNNLGSEDTTSPYSISWDTTGASGGSHTLTAVARDAAGNSTTSSPVGVTVSNGIGGGTLVYEWQPLASWIDGVALSNRDANDVHLLSRFTNSSAATVGSTLPKSIVAIGGQQDYCFNRAPTGDPSIEIHTTGGNVTASRINFAVQLWDHMSSGSGPHPRHVRVVMEVRTCKPSDATTYKANGLGTTTGSYPVFANTHHTSTTDTVMKYFIGLYAGQYTGGGGSINWWNSSTFPINRATARMQTAGSSKYLRPYIYNFDRPNQYGQGVPGTIKSTDSGVEGVWHRLELEAMLTTPSTVPENARRASPVVEPTRSGDGFVKMYITKDLNGELGTPGTRTEFASLENIIWFPKHDDVGTNDNMHTLANIAGPWFYWAYGGSTGSQAEGWAWIRKVQVYRHD